jgi:hypothetical protein
MTLAAIGDWRTMSVPLAHPVPALVLLAAYPTINRRSQFSIKPAAFGTGCKGQTAPTNFRYGRSQTRHASGFFSSISPRQPLICALSPCSRV